MLGAGTEPLCLSCIRCLRGSGRGSRWAERRSRSDPEIWMWGCQHCPCDGDTRRRPSESRHGGVVGVGEGEPENACAEEANQSLFRPAVGPGRDGGACRGWFRVRQGSAGLVICGRDRERRTAAETSRQKHEDMQDTGCPVLDQFHDLLCTHILLFNFASPVSPPCSGCRRHSAAGR